MRVFLSAGEASGDAYGAELVRALEAVGAFTERELAQDLVTEFTGEGRGRSNAAKEIASIYGGRAVRGRDGELSQGELVEAVTSDIQAGLIDGQRLRKETLSAVGGRRLRDVGVGLTVDSSTWGAVGIIESLFVAPKVIEGFLTARSLLRIAGPGLFVPIDFGYVNVKLAREAKDHGWKVLYFVPPGSWRKDKQGADLPRVTDAIVTPFPWSAKILQDMGANAHFFGHPLRQMVARSQAAGERTGIAVLPGSRSHEVARNLEAIVEAVRGFGSPLKFAVAPNLDALEVERLWSDLGGGPAEFSRDTYTVLKSSQAAIVCSGTATLEAALCRCPMVVMYRFSRIMEIEALIRRPKFDYISLPNIVLGRRVVPELIQHDASPERIRAELESIAVETSARKAQLMAFEELAGALGPEDCFQRSAELALGLFGRPS